jgi:predicted TIM-barrel fold metal-dependent hydrolase
VRVTDVHVHIQPWDQLKPEVAAAMKRGRPDLEQVQRYIADPDAFVAFLDEQGIARVGLINYPSQDLMGFDERVNDFVAAYRDRHPSRFIAFGGLHPRFVRDPKAEVRRLLHELRVDAVKLHPPHMLVRANGHVDGDAALAALYEGCQEAGVPVMVHTGTSVFPRARGKFGDPMDCDDVAVDFPDLRLVLAHAGRPIWMETAVHLARRHRNVYLDLSGIPPKSLLEYLPKLESLASKCLFGTDWPSPGVRSIRENVDAFLELPISDDAKARILSGTADALWPPLLDSARGAT